MVMFGVVTFLCALGSLLFWSWYSPSDVDLGLSVLVWCVVAPPPPLCGGAGVCYTLGSSTGGLVVLVAQTR